MVEGASLENWKRRKAFAGSNPALSASIPRPALAVADGFGGTHGQEKTHGEALNKSGQASALDEPSCGEG